MATVITADQVKTLRDKTGAGMMECKAALSEANGDLDEAVTILRKRGVAHAAKRSGRATGEGLVAARLSGDSATGVIAEINCESDFVARTEDFQTLVNDVIAAFLARRDAGQLEQHADLAAEMDVGAEHAAIRLDAAHARDGDVLARLRNRRRHLLGDGGAGRDDAGRIGPFGRGEQRGGHVGDERLEIIGARDEVRFAVDLGDHAGLAVARELGGNDAFAGRAAGSLRGLGDAALAEDRDTLVDVAVGFAQGGLALHHPGAGLVAQGFYLISGDYGGHAVVPIYRLSSIVSW